MTHPPLISLGATNYGCLDQIDVALKPLSVLVGPNGSGKSTLLDIIQFLGDAVREDLGPALDRRRGFESLRFRGAAPTDPIKIRVKAAVTAHANENAPDEYELIIRPVAGSSGLAPSRLFLRQEAFTFKRTRGPGRRLKIAGTKVTVSVAGKPTEVTRLNKQSLGLATLPRLAIGKGGEQVELLARLFESFRVFEVDVTAARQPALVTGDAPIRLASDASNLSAFLHLLSGDPERFEDLLRDAREMIPGLVTLHFVPVGGAGEAVVTEIEEAWLPGRTPLAKASYGTIRVLALLALLYDPAPPKLTCMEEIDHGLHPHVFDRLVELMRRASRSTQLLIATHSPALVNRLQPSELIVCERNPKTGGVRIPTLGVEEIERMVEATGGALGVGELWFSGQLGGVP
jgi:predicted ATPase